MNPVLSILIPTIPGREAQAHALIAKLEDQIGELPVEILCLSDNRKRTIGGKRQSLVDIASGYYIAFVDDDDDVSDDYVSEILKATASRPDVITFRQASSYKGIKSEIVFGINNQDQPYNPDGITFRAPWHVCAWRRDRIRTCQFGLSNYGEDIVWCQQARQMARHAHHIDKVLHNYTHDPATTSAPENVTPRQ